MSVMQVSHQISGISWPGTSLSLDIKKKQNVETGETQEKVSLFYGTVTDGAACRKCLFVCSTLHLFLVYREISPDLFCLGLAQ